MMYRTLLCVALFVGSASAWGNWFGSNRDTECGSFRNERRGWLFTPSSPAVNTRHVLDDLKAFDTNKDGNLTFSEMYNPEVASTQGSSLILALNGGVDRCTFVKLEMERYGISKAVAGRLFDLDDVNNDLLINSMDQDEATFLLLDKDGDGRVPVCDVFNALMARLADLEHKAYSHELKYAELVYKFRKPSLWWSGWW